VNVNLGNPSLVKKGYVMTRTRHLALLLFTAELRKPDYLTNSNQEMANPITFSATDIDLILAVLKQIEVGKVDYGILQKELNLVSKNAAQIRWSRFNSKLKKYRAGAGMANTEGDEGGHAKGTSVNETLAKKRKMEIDDQEDGGFMKAEIKDEWEEKPRRMPSRKKRAQTFQDEFEDFQFEEFDNENEA
jgi:hypothetical protein